MPLDEEHSACIDENAVLDFVQGRLGKLEVARIDEHADGCLSCRKAIDGAVRAFRERSTGVDNDPPIQVTRFAVGDKLADRYRIVHFIARGGMGEVYEAEDEMLGTRIAVKTIAAAIADNPQSARRLKQEVNLARRITHPNVCRIFDLGVHDPDSTRPGRGVLFITMELIHGMSLAQRVKDEGRFSPEAALPIVTAMAAALGAAHRAGVVHRDFKSDNVMLAAGGPGGERIVVMDFGLARNASFETHDSTQGRGLEGTLAYMAPEQLEGQSAREPADIYALGLVMYEMLAGQLPFAPASGKPWLKAAWQRVVEPIPPVRSLVPEVDARWNSVIARCLEKEIDRRPASPDDVIRALTSDPVPEPPAAEAPPPEPAPPPARHTGRWLVGAAVSLAAIVATAAALHHRPPPDSARPASATTPPSDPLPRESGGGSARGPAEPAPPSAAAPAPSGSLPRESGGGSARGPATHPRPPHHQPLVTSDPVATPTSTPDASQLPTPPSPRRRSADPDDGFIFK